MEEGENGGGREWRRERECKQSKEGGPGRDRERKGRIECEWVIVCERESVEGGRRERLTLNHLSPPVV